MKARFVIYAMAVLATSMIVESAAAHKPSDSYLTLTVAGDKIEGRWDIALRDLAWFDVEQRCWRLGEPDWRIGVGGSSADEDQIAVELTLPEQTWSIRER